MSTRLEASPVFIGGVPRSGTTLLRNMLDGHPQLVVHPGTYGFFTTFLPLARGMSSLQRTALAERTLLRYNFTNREAAHPNGTRVQYANVRAAFERRLQESAGRLPDYLAAAILGIAEASGVLDDRKCRWVEKACFNEFRSQQIFAWWPDAKLIQLVRDPRATYAARLRRKAEHNTVSGFARSWESSARQGRKNMKEFGADRCLTVRYESLVSDSIAQATRLAQFLEVSDEPILLQPTIGDGRLPWKGNSAYGGSFSGIAPTSLDRWRQVLTARQAALLDLLLRKEMSAEGYLPRPDHAVLLRAEAALLSAFNAIRQMRDWLLRGRPERPVRRWLVQ